MKRLTRRANRTGFLLGLAVALVAMGAATRLNAAEEKPGVVSGYPAYRGDGSGAATDSGAKLISSWSDARRVWSSEEPAPPLGFPGRPFNDGPVGAGGFGVPVLVSNRIYVGYWIPSGPDVVHNGPVAPGRPLKVDADEVVICMDAMTGKTLWRTVFERKGWNFASVYYSDGQITPCVAKGKVLMLGSTGRAYCLDAQTGKVLWEKPTGKVALAWERYKAAVLDGKDQARRMAAPDRKYLEEVLAPRPPANPSHGGSGGGGFNSTPGIFGDLAIFNLMGQETVAYDLETGKERWSRKGSGMPMAASVSIVKWTHQGKEYLIDGGACVDPATGKDMWTFGPLGGGYQGYTPATSGDLWVGVGNNGKTARGENRLFVVCYRLSPEGAKIAWRLPDGTAFTYQSPVIHRGKVYASMGWEKRERSAEEMEAITGTKDYAGPNVGGGMDACLDLETGKLKAAVPMDLNDQGTSPFAMDGRVFFHGWHMYDAQPEAKGVWKRLATIPRSLVCTFPTGANGFLYLRAAGGRSLVECWDLRGEETK